MINYIDMMLVALLTIYIVDISGFKRSWRILVAKLLHIRELRPLPPFDCSLCMVWWVGIAYSLIVGTLSLPMLSFIALLSFLSVPIGQLFILIREGMNKIVSQLMELL